MDPLFTVHIPGEGNSVFRTFLPSSQFSTERELVRKEERGLVRKQERVLVRKQGHPVMSSGNHAATRGGCPIPCPPPAPLHVAPSSLCLSHGGANAGRAFKHFALTVLLGVSLSALAGGDSGQFMVSSTNLPLVLQLSSVQEAHCFFP